MHAGLLPTQPLRRLPRMQRAPRARRGPAALGAPLAVVVVDGGEQVPLVLQEVDGRHDLRPAVLARQRGDHLRRSARAPSARRGRRPAGAFSVKQRAAP